MAFFAALFLASFRSCLKKQVHYENVCDLMFSFSCDALENVSTFR